jgi:hypothetical protein
MTDLVSDTGIPLPYTSRCKIPLPTWFHIYQNVATQVYYLLCRMLLKMAAQVDILVIAQKRLAQSARRLVSPEDRVLC